jgi:hypothetical protein
MTKTKARKDAVKSSEKHAFKRENRAHESRFLRNLEGRDPPRLAALPKVEFSYLEPENEPCLLSFPRA